MGEAERPQKTAEKSEGATVDRSEFESRKLPENAEEAQRELLIEMEEATEEREARESVGIEEGMEEETEFEEAVR